MTAWIEELMTAMLFVLISENKGRLGEFIMDFFFFFKGHNEDNFFSFGPSFR